MLLWADLDGASHNTLDLRANLKDRDYFQKVVSTGQPAVSNGLMSKSTNKPIVVFAVPILDDNGKVGGTGCHSNARLSNPNLQRFKINK